MKTAIDLNNKNILITGAAGFIGAALTQRILREYMGCCIIGLDNLNDYYDPALKEYRLKENDKAQRQGLCSYQFIRGSIADKALVDKVFKEHNPDIVVNLAAQAGVRYSIDHPDIYIESNIA